MLHRIARFIAALMICMPIGDALHPGWLSRLTGQTALDSSAAWWLGPRELILCAGCVMVLFLTDLRRRQYGFGPTG